MDRSSTQEQQPFVDGVIEHVVECYNCSDGGQRRQMIGTEGERRSQTDQDHPDILNTRVRQQSLDVSLGKRQHISHDHGDRR